MGILSLQMEETHNGNLKLGFQYLATVCLARKTEIQAFFSVLFILMNMRIK